MTRQRAIQYGVIQETGSVWLQSPGGKPNDCRCFAVRTHTHTRVHAHTAHATLTHAIKRQRRGAVVVLW